MIPDHFILHLEIVTTCTKDVNGTVHSDNSGQLTKNDAGPIGMDDIYFKGFDVRSVPLDFFASNITRQVFILMIDKIEQIQSSQNKMDNAYNADLCQMYYHEMNVWFKCKNIPPSARKRLRSSLKPFWTIELQCLWNSLRKTETSFCKSAGSQERAALARFQTAQDTFDKTYRREERRYKRVRLIEIEVLTKDPRRFWEMLGKIGSKKSQDIPIKVYDENGSILSDINSIHVLNMDPKTLITFFYEECVRNLSNR